MRKGAKSIARLGVLLLAAAIFQGSFANAAKAIDFRVSGEWLVGFGAGTGQLYSHFREPGFGPKQKVDSNDVFEANQRIRLQLDAVASESLSGTVYFEIGDQRWGLAEDGAALGADGKIVKVKGAYIDWAVPDVPLTFRMGLQGIALPNAAGGSAIMDGDVAGVAANYAINENVGISLTWMRPVNDNFTSAYGAAENQQGYLDNMDLIALSIPITLGGLEITPWIMYGMLGQNALRGLQDYDEERDEPWETSDGVLGLTIPGLTPGFNYAGETPLTASHTSKAYGSMFWAGLPIKLTMLDPWNFEFDINYGYVEAMGKFDVMRRGDPTDIVRGSTERQGWLVKALAEYKAEWVTPGIFGWYSSGDDSNIKNGSERMPTIAGAGNFTSFIGDGNLAWGSFNDSCDWSMSYAGTWGIGLQLADMSFMEDLSHTFRVAYWGGTNSPSMVKYMESAYSWSEGYGGDGPYLTTHDGLLEFNLVNQWQIYENLELNLELGYVVNMMDKGTWEKSSYYNEGNGKFEKQDAWKAQLTFAYTF